MSLQPPPRPFLPCPGTRAGAAARRNAPARYQRPCQMGTPFKNAPEMLGPARLVFWPRDLSCSVSHQSRRPPAQPAVQPRSRFNTHLDADGAELARQKRGACRSQLTLAPCGQGRLATTGPRPAGQKPRLHEIQRNSPTPAHDVAVYLWLDCAPRRPAPARAIGRYPPGP